jgi:hypothetical protein
VEINAIRVKELFKYGAHSPAPIMLKILV